MLYKGIWNRAALFKWTQKFKPTYFHSFSSLKLSKPAFIAKYMTFYEMQLPVAFKAGESL